MDNANVSSNIETIVEAVLDLYDNDRIFLEDARRILDLCREISTPDEKGSLLKYNRCGFCLRKAPRLGGHESELQERKKNTGFGYAHGFICDECEKNLGFDVDPT